MLKLASLLSAPRAVSCWLGIGSDAGPAARIVLFHGTPCRDVAALERQLRWLKRRFDVVPLRSLFAAAGNGGALEQKVALTFDDGLRSNVQFAYPLLHRLALPATFFVCPALVDRADWLWTHEARRRLARLEAPAQRELAQECRAPADRDGFVEWMKTLPLGRRLQIEARLREATPRFVPTAREREDFDLASWAELRRLDPALVTIGSHTLTHPILTRTPAASVEAEVAESRRQLERDLQRPVEFFAYPNGDCDDAVAACVRRHYRGAVIASRGRFARGADTFRLPRLAAPRGVLRLARRAYA